MAATVFALSAGRGYGPHRLSDPALVSALAAIALRELSPWSGEAAAARADALARVRPLRDLVLAVAGDPVTRGV
jgi:hypothetical protein